MAKSPLVHIYFVAMGQWTGNGHIESRKKALIQSVERMNSYQPLEISIVDANRFLAMCDEVDNRFVISLDTIDSTSYPSVKGVDSSEMSLISAPQLINLLSTEEGFMRNTLFKDNVRDFQDGTNVNNEIYTTLKTKPHTFSLLNNGITIVCDSATTANRKIRIENPQIVNGCQTANILYKAYQDGLNIDDVYVSVKIISTKDSALVNEIVRGTNRQNIVHDEAFEITKKFHKELEDYFEAVSENSRNKIFYERRSRQYDRNTRIKPYQKINFRYLIQSYVAIFMDEPYYSHLHENSLLKKYQNRIFKESDTSLPYYVAALLMNQLERLYRTKKLSGETRKFKYHIGFLFRFYVAGSIAELSTKEDYKNYCKKLTYVINDPKDFVGKACETEALFIEAKNERTSERDIIMVGLLKSQKILMST